MSSREHRSEHELPLHAHDQEGTEEKELGAQSHSHVSAQVEWSRCRRMSEMIFPFLKLQKKAGGDGPSLMERTVRSSRTEEQTFCVLFATYILSIIMFIYLLLTISCWSLEFEDKEAKLGSKVPHTGRDYGKVLFAKEIAQLLVLHHLCGGLMEPMEELHEHRTDPCMIDGDDGRQVSLLKETAGVARSLLGVVRLSRFYCCSLCARRRSRPEQKWLNTFIADHFLLFGVGFGAICHQVSLLYLKFQQAGRKNKLAEEISHYFGLDEWMDVVIAIATTHMAIQVMGFLYTTLESNVVPKKARKKEFALFMSLFIFLWMVDFLVIVLDRQVFTGSFQGAIFYGHRIFAAMAQIFVSHSTVMLGAVFLGHSCHFMKSPDLEWWVFLSKGVPFIILTAIYIFALRLRRLSHSNLSCAHGFSKGLSEAWPYIDLSMDISLGAILLGLSFWNQRNGQHAELENGELMKVFDYDKALVTFTFAASILYYINQIFYAWGVLSAGWSWVAAIMNLIGPIGLASFTISVWRWPPRMKSGGAQGRILGLALWVALFSAATQFVDFQDKEDCEISSDSPGCCNYPSLPDWNRHEDRWRTCDHSVRCSEKNHDEDLGGDVYCALPKHEESRMDYRALMTDEGKFTDAECQTLKERWNAFTAYENRSALQAETEEEEESLSSTFRLFNLLGQAASVEMYFTIFGVLLKVIFRSWHKHSETILEMGHHQHHEDHHGHQTTVCVGRKHGCSGSAMHTPTSMLLQRSPTSHM